MTTINFPNKLGSDRADGKLIDTDLIAASPGQVFVTGVREDAHTVTISLVDEVGAASNIVIPKMPAGNIPVATQDDNGLMSSEDKTKLDGILGSGTIGEDGQARGAAESAQVAAGQAQAEIDGHEAAGNPHAESVGDDDLAAEVARRAAGDQLTSTTIGTSVALSQALDDQETSDGALEIVFTAEVTLDGNTYLEKDVVYIPPRSRAIESRFNVGGGGGDGDGEGGGVDADARRRIAALEGKFPVQSADIGHGQVGVRQLETGYIRETSFPDSATIRTKDIGNNEVTGAKIPANTIERGHMQDQSVGETELTAGVRGQLFNAAANGRVTGNTNRIAALEGRPAAGTDQTARDDAAAAAAAAATADGKAVAAQEAADAAQAAAATADAKAVAAQLDADTAIEVGPEFIHNEVGPKVLGINIRHPLNAYPTATIMSVRAAGQVGVLVGYDHTELTQHTLAEIGAAALDNIWSNTIDIPDGMGGTRTVQEFSVGSYIGVEIRLLTGRGGDTVFFRNVDVLVIEDPATEITRIANARAAATPGPALIVRNITSWNAAQNRFEDVNGNAVAIPDGSQVFLTQAVYDAAEADAQYVRNNNAVFHTR